MTGGVCKKEFCCSSIHNDNRLLMIPSLCKQFQFTIRTYFIFNDCSNCTFWRRFVINIVLRLQPILLRSWLLVLILFHFAYSKNWRVSLVYRVNETPHGTSWKQPCNTCMNILYHKFSTYNCSIQNIVRFFA